MNSIFKEVTMRTEKQVFRRFNIPAMMIFFFLFLFSVGLLVPHPAFADTNQGTVKMKQMDTRQLRAAIADAPRIDWSSSNTGVCVMLNQSGLIQAVGGGSCTITAVGGGKTLRWTIKVTPLQLKQTSLTLMPRREGAALKLNNKTAQRDAYWHSNHPRIASVSSSGYITPHEPGKAVIKVTWNNITLSCTVHVLTNTEANLRKFRTPKRNRKRTVIAGSTLLDYWSTASDDFRSTRIINNAIAGSTFANWQVWCKSLITDYKPKAVVISLGTEDIGDGTGMTAEQCAANMQGLIESIRARSKKTKIFFVSIPRYPERESSWAVVNAYNEQMRTYCAEHKKYAVFLDLAGALDSSQFRSGHLSLTSSGYKTMKKVVVKKVRKVAKR